MNFLQIIGYSLLVVNFVFMVINILGIRLTTKVKIAISILLVLLANGIPVFNHLPLVALMNGCFSDLSITTIIILGAVFFDNSQDKVILLPKIFPMPVQLTILFFGIMLYISVIGILKLDIYDLGYQPTYLLYGFCLLELLFLYTNKWFAIIWFLALVGFYFNFQNSTNFWDYLFDPFLWVFAILINLRRCK